MPKHFYDLRHPHTLLWPIAMRAETLQWVWVYDYNSKNPSHKLKAIY